MKHLYLLLVLLTSAVSYKILCFHTVPSKSHFHLLNGVVEPLLNAGHQVLFATTYPEAVKSHANITILDLSRNIDFLNDIDMSDPSVSKKKIKIFARNISLATIKTPVIRDTMINDQVDAVVTEWFFTHTDAGYAAIQQVPWIILSSYMTNVFLEQMMGTEWTTHTIPIVIADHPIPMTFWHRLQNMMTYCLMQIDDWLSIPTYKLDYEDNFGPLAAARGISLPPFNEIYRNISILLTNSHPSFAPARSIPPNMIEIGGYHIDANIRELPKDLKQILDSSPQGVIYFSMGSVLKPSAINDNTRRELLQVFGSLQQTVLWKCDHKIDDLPKNVHVRSWMPQSSVLAHPNVKIFMTHSGLLSTMESIHYGVPLLAIPVFADQPFNAARCVEAGHALIVRYSVEMAADVKVALVEMINNDRYYKRAKEMSKLFKKRLNKPSDLITHYIEVAIETKGAPHLRSINNQYRWYEYLMLDQMLFICVILYLIYRLIKMFNCSIKQKND